MSTRCKTCKRHRCGRCGWTGRRKTGTVGACARCSGHVTVHAVMHKSWVRCSLGEEGGKHKQSECRWCHRVRRNDKMRRWDGQMECRDSHGCARVHKQRVMERERR